LLRGERATDASVLVKSIAEALAETMALFRALPEEELAVASARGRFVVADVPARLDVPSFDASTVDGYAVRTSDLAGATDDANVTLPVRGESRTGARWHSELEPRAAMRIFTGSRVPPGADAVVMQENVRVEKGLASFARAPVAGACIRIRASDVAAGDVLLAGGARLDPASLGLLSSQGQATVLAYRRPRVAIVTTGDELRSAGEPLPEGAIYDANAPMLAAQVESAGGVPIVLARVRDDLDETTARLGQALSVADVVLTSGGVSVGDHDVLHEAFERLGVARQFWKVRMKPGKPLAVGAMDGIPVIGLPGNPVSSWVTFEIFVRPAIRRMLGDPRPFRSLVDVELGKRVKPTVDRVELARARIEHRAGQMFAWPVAKQSSSALVSAVECDALLVLPEREAPLEVGTRCDALLLSGPGSARASFYRSTS
jgi:molybdopterin molybdotransferase